MPLIAQESVSIDIKHTIENNFFQKGNFFHGEFKVSKSDIFIGAGLIGGYQPVHIDKEHARSKGLKDIILHGSLTAAMMSSLLGQQLPIKGWRLLGQSSEFRRPVFPEDIISAKWHISKIYHNAKICGNIVDFKGVGINQDSIIVINSTINILVM